MFGLPKVVNAADGVGNRARVGNGAVQVVFRKMLFDGSLQNFRDLHVTGTLRGHAAKPTGQMCGAFPNRSERPSATATLPRRSRNLHNI
jgi:hypothetical protein